MEKRLACKLRPIRNPRKSHVNYSDIESIMTSRILRLNNITTSRDGCLVRRTKTNSIHKKHLHFFANQTASKVNKHFMHSMKQIPLGLQGPRSQKKFPREIINILYRQQISNYNPYLNALQSVQSQTNVLQQERIKDLCFMGLAKTHLTNQKYRSIPTYSRVNILIRTYMLGLMRQEIQVKAEEKKKTIYIPVQETALSFNHRDFPCDLKGIVSEPAYSAAIRHVNSIIEKEYIRYKYASMRSTLGWTRSEIGTSIITAILLIVLIFTNSGFIAFLIPIVILLGFLLSTWECKTRLNTIHAAKNICDNIMIEIQDYFKGLNGQQIEWRIGTDFYWIEINYIHKRRNYLFQDHYEKSINKRRVKAVTINEAEEYS